MIKITDKTRCCACRACVQACPAGCISMAEDSEGFLYPVADESKCLECGLCDRSCPYNSDRKKRKPLKIISAINNNRETRTQSSSGGIFSLIAEKTIEKGGTVFGAVLDSDMSIAHAGISDKNGIAAMRGSKYVQSFLSDTFKKVEYDLKQNKQVLFTGTPCQVGGLKSYLRKDYDNLFTVDIICHGVMSPLIFDETILCLKKIYGDFDSLSFRDKTIAWRGSHISINKNGRKISETRQLNSLKRLYYGHYATRPSCHDCKFTNVDRVSDITIGDFWGIENENAKFEDRLGISFVMVNSSKGERLLDNCKNDCHIITEKIENCKQPQLYTSSKPSSQREQFWADFNSKGYKYVYSKYAHATFVSSSIDKIKNIVKKTINKFR